MDQRNRSSSLSAPIRTKLALRRQWSRVLWPENPIWILLLPLKLIKVPGPSGRRPNTPAGSQEASSPLLSPAHACPSHALLPANPQSSRPAHGLFSTRCFLCLHCALVLTANVYEECKTHQKDACCAQSSTVSARQSQHTFCRARNLCKVLRFPLLDGRYSRAGRHTLFTFVSPVSSTPFIKEETQKHCEMKGCLKLIP